MRKIRHVSVAAMMLVAVSSCSNDKQANSTSDALATDALVPAIQSILDLGAGTAESAVTLSECPLGDFAALIAKGPAALQTSAQGSGGESGHAHRDRDAFVTVML